MAADEGGSCAWAGASTSLVVRVQLSITVSHKPVSAFLMASFVSYPHSDFKVWLAISDKARLPKTDEPPLRIVRFSQKTLAYGVQEHRIEGVPVRIFSPAKTVADCFRYRNKIGLDVALEALRECTRKRRATSDELWQAAKVCRVANVMHPYLESLS